MTVRNFTVSEVKLVYKNKVKAADRIQINNPQDAFEVFWEAWDKEIIEHIEEMKMLLMDRSNKVLGIVSLSKGGTTGTVIDIKVMMQYALKANAHGIILAHNHPSGNLNPSDADRKITERAEKGCKTLEIHLMDHLIISPGKEYRSMMSQ
jgi:DNA repair protein RadC